MEESIKISESTKGKLTKMAAEAGLSADILADALLSAFVDGEGKIYTGKWKEGPGIRLLPDWPKFSSSVIKIKEEKG